MRQGFRPQDSATLLRGAGRYCDDIALPGALRAVFLRSDVPCGRIKTLDFRAARTMPGVRAVHGGANVAHLGALPVNEVIALDDAAAFPVLARGHVSAVGQPVAAVLAETRAAGQDAAEAIELDIIDEAPPPPLRLAGQTWHQGAAEDTIAQAALTVTASLQHARLVPLSMEPRCIAARPDDDGGVTIWHATQTPHRTRSHLARILGIDSDLIRVTAPDVGGAFGMKASLYPEEVYCVWAALQLNTPVRWSATRSEDFVSATHGRGAATHGTLALDAEGRFAAMTADIKAPLGYFLPNSALIPAWNAGRVLPGPYRIDEVRIDTQAVREARAPVGIYRGAGRPEAAALMERLVDKAARATGIDPFDIRLRNLPAAAALPVVTATGQTLDSGDYAGALRLLRQLGAYDARRADARQRRARGELVGLGIALFLEPSGEGWESARLTWHENGRLEIASGSSAQGQARARSYARIAADALNLSPEAIDILYADTETCPEGIGALASRSTPIGGSAVLMACHALDKARKDGAAFPISHEVRYETKGQAWGYGAYLVQISIERETGKPRIEAAICVDDSGRVIDAQAVADQIVGGFAQGLGEAVMESAEYDSGGQLLTASLMDYAVPRADDMPPLDLHKMETPSPMNPLGAKGVGEAGTIGAPIAILNAAIDALAPLGVTDLQMPLSPQKLWQAIQMVQKGKTDA